MTYKAAFKIGGPIPPVNQSRRSFLRTGMIAGAGAGISWGILSASAATKSRLAVPFSPPNDPVNFFTQANFLPHVNTAFYVRLKPDRAVAVTLAGVEDRRPLGVTAVSVSQGECFSLRFNVPRRNWFAQGIRDLEHSELGKFSLFLAPVDRPGRQLFFEAIINRTVA